MKFSVLMSIYHKEKAEYFDRAMKSIWDEQTVKPDEIVLVQDGKLTDELYSFIDEWKSKLGDVLKIVPLEQNVGTGQAKNIALNNCKFDLVAVMDTDDICVKDRFEKQLKVFEEKNIDICGGLISEFDDAENTIVSYRKVPEFHEEIKKYSKKRNGVNHMTAMYKKNSIMRCGAYQHMLYFEDYYLWCRAFTNGAKFYNIQEPLCNVRLGNDMIGRRHGFSYIIKEYKFLNAVRKLGFLNNYEFVRNMLVRFSVRILPKNLLKKIYKKIRG